MFTWASASQSAKLLSECLRTLPEIYRAAKLRSAHKYLNRPAPRDTGPVSLVVPTSVTDTRMSPELTGRTHRPSNLANLKYYKGLVFRLKMFRIFMRLAIELYFYSLMKVQVFNEIQNNTTSIKNGWSTDVTIG